MTIIGGAIGAAWTTVATGAAGAAYAGGASPLASTVLVTIFEKGGGEPAVPVLAGFSWRLRGLRSPGLRAAFAARVAPVQSNALGPAGGLRQRARGRAKLLANSLLSSDPASVPMMTFGIKWRSASLIPPKEKITELGHTHDGSLGAASRTTVAEPTPLRP